jgi:hypothetical protein
MPSLFYLPRVTSLAGSKLYFYQTGTSTPQNVYTDEALSVAHSSPVVADGDGVFAPIYLDPTLPHYRVTHHTSADVLIYTVDDVPSNQNVQQSMRLESTNPFLFLYDTDGTSGSRKYRIRSAGAAFEVQSSNEAESVFTTILKYESGILYSNATEVAVTTNGTFSGSLSGMTAATSGTFNYRKVNNIASVWLTTGITGTSNSSSMSLSTLPAAIRPSAGQSVHCIVTDAGNSELDCVAIIGTDGVVRFDIAKTDGVANYVQYSQSGFTGSGTKGLAGSWSITFPVS